MIIYKAKDYQDMSRKAANIISAQIIMNPKAVLGLATGSTPIGTYKQLVEWFEKGDLDFSEITTVNLDEYKNIGKSDKNSYYYFMNEMLFSKVNIQSNHTFIPDGTQMDSEKACIAYNEVIKDVGGVDLQLLGLGHNGHIGFNEPGASFAKETHCVDLSERTIQENQRFFDALEEVPKQAYTMGIKTIMHASKILLLVSGKDKAQVLKETLFGPITPKVPGSILQLHRDVTIVADEAALFECSVSEKEYV